jgi:hypothetical protein
MITLDLALVPDNAGAASRAGSKGGGGVWIRPLRYSLDLDWPAGMRELEAAETLLLSHTFNLTGAALDPRQRALGHELHAGLRRAFALRRKQPAAAASRAARPRAPPRASAPHFTHCIDLGGCKLLL